MSRPKIGECPACKKYGPLTNHHVMPRRFYGGSGPLVRLCRDCHWGLEAYIPIQHKMPDDFYPMVVEWFINKETWVEIHGLRTVRFNCGERYLLLQLGQVLLHHRLLTQMGTEKQMLKPILVPCCQCGLIHYSDESIRAYGTVFCSKHCLDQYEAEKRKTQGGGS